MKYLQVTQFVYIVIAAFLFYKGITSWNTDSDEKWLYFILGAMCIVMFFVRRKILGRMNGNKQP